MIHVIKGFPILPMGKVWSAWTSWVVIDLISDSGNSDSTSFEVVSAWDESQGPNSKLQSCIYEMGPINGVIGPL